MPFSGYCARLRDTLRPGRRRLLVQTPQLLLAQFSVAVARNRGYYAFPPTGLQYLFESVREALPEVEVRILDLNLEILRHVCDHPGFDPGNWLELLDAHLDAFDPGIVGVSCMFDSGIEPLFAILERLKRRGDAIVVIGGVIATYEWRAFLEPGLCHFAVAGEGEARLPYLLAHLLDRPPPPATTGIRYRPDDRILETVGRADPVSFDHDLIASYDQVRIEENHRYGSLNPFSRMSGEPFAAIQLHRGCRAACTFCSVRDFMGRRVRHRPVATVLREMAFLIETRGVRHFEWLDDDLLFYKAAFQELLRRIIERGWPITWAANNGVIASAIDPETMALMRASGCVGFKIGFETGNPEILQSIRKPGNLDRYERACLVVRGFPEIFVGANLIIGFPGERFGQMMDTFRFHMHHALDWGGFTICQAIRGASAFSVFSEHFDAQIQERGARVENFVPARTAADGQVGRDDGIHRGYALFSLDPEAVPDAAQIREIWFTFNMVGNFICNRNLQPDGRVDQFIAWVTQAQAAYPDNPCMLLFLALAHRLADAGGPVEDCLKRAAAVHDASGYWQERFADFHLTPLLASFPATAAAVFSELRRLSGHVDRHLRRWNVVSS